MKIENYQFNKSSFLSVEKDMSLIVDKMMSNQRLKKLLYYTQRDALRQPNLSEEESIGLLGSHIRIVPKLYVEAPVKAYIVISFNNFIQNFTNPEFRDNDISFFIMCHYDQWQLEDFQLRPYRIAAELDSMFDKKRFTGIGRLEFQGTQGISISDELAGLHLSYRAIHGGEDKVHALSPEQEKILFGDN